MHKDLRILTFCFAAGCAAALFLPKLPDPWLIRMLCAAAGVLLCACLRAPRLRLPAAICCGFAWTVLQGHAILQPRLPEGFSGQFVMVTGTVASLPETRGKQVRFLFLAETMQDARKQEHAYVGRIRLNWRSAPQPIRPGQRWRLQVKLKPPNGFSNPGGFDYETWLFRKRIHATGYVRGKGLETLLPSAGRWRPSHALHGLRQALSQHIEQTAPGDQSGLIRALALGDRSGITSRQWAALRHTGTQHLLAISGLHVGMAALWAFWAGRLLWSLFPALSRRLPASFAALWCALLGSCLYAGLAGFSLPTQRALIMLAACLSGSLCGHRRRLSFAFAGAVGCILLLDPFSLLAAEFWLSFLAVCLIFHLLRGRGGAALWRTQFLLPLGMAPILLFWFQEWAVYSCVANLVAVPLVAWIIAPIILLATLALAVFPEGAAFLFSCAGYALHGLLRFLEFVQTLPMASWRHPAPSVWICLSALLGMGTLLLPRVTPGRGLGLFLLLPLLFPSRPEPAMGEFHLHLLDVGQGLSALVKTRNHSLIYDTGDFWSEHFNAADSVILPFLRHQGIRRTDILLLSHNDRDHVGSSHRLAGHATRVLGNFPRPGSTPDPCLAGQEWAWDGVMFRILHPRPGQHMNDNNLSCVLLIRQTDGRSALLTGDIEALAETQLLLRQRAWLDADVLIVPHHGSRSSSTKEFVAAVSPEIALFATGYLNRFRMPHPEVTRTYRQAGAQTYSSAGSGALRVTPHADGVSWEVREHRREHRRFWRRIPRQP